MIGLFQNTNYFGQSQTVGFNKETIINIILKTESTLNKSNVILGRYTQRGELDYKSKKGTYSLR